MVKKLFSMLDNYRIKKRKRFIYCLYPNNYYSFISAQAIEELSRRYPHAEHIVYPLYGISIYSSCDSRYSKILKRIFLIFKYMKSEFDFSNNTRDLLLKYLNEESSKKIRFVSTWKYIYYLIITFISRKRRFNKYMDTRILEAYSYRGIKLGDLIIDTYLKYRGVAKTNLKDPYLSDIAWRANAIVHLTASITNTKCECYLFGSYGTYIHHGIPLRSICAHSGCGITFGKINPPYIIHRGLEKNLTPTHAGYHHKYSHKDARELPQSTLDAAKISIMNRVRNIYDDSMVYMNGQSLEPTRIDRGLKYIEGGVLMMLHDFFDAPHGYQWMLFTDFWEWATETIRFCIDNNLHVNLKPHPNQIPENDDIIGQLKSETASEFVHWLPKNVLNEQLFSLNPKVITTVYGSVTVEAAWNKIPVIVAGDFPGINFDFANVAKSKREYFQLLKRPPNSKKNVREEAILFTALHHKESFANVDKKTIPGQLNVSIEDLEKNEQLLTSDKSKSCTKLIIQKLIKELDLENGEEL